MSKECTDAVGAEYLGDFTFCTSADCTCCVVPGDANDGGKANIADVTFLIARIFANGQGPPCADEGDADGDNKVNIADVTFLIARIFAGGPAPVCT